MPKLVYSFGVGTPYLENNTLKLEPGQSYTYTITIQNNEDLQFDVQIKYNSDNNIAYLIPANMHILPKTFNNVYNFQIQIPKEAKPGDLYVLSYAAKPLLNVSGQVPMVVEIARKVTILVVDKYGQGYTETQYDKILKSLNTYATKTKKTLVNILSPWGMLILALTIIVMIFFILIRFWGLSTKISNKFFNLSSKVKTIRNKQELEEKQELTKSLNSNQSDSSKLEEWKKFRVQLLRYYENNPNGKIHGKDFYYWLKQAEENINKLQNKKDK